MNDMTNDKGNSKRFLVRGIISALVIGAVVSVSVVACGGHGHRMSPKMMKRMALGFVDDVMDEIDATDAQRATFEALAEDIVNEGLAMKKDHKAHKAFVLNELSKPTPDREALKAHMDEKFSRLEDFAHRTLDKVLDAYETLDADQKAIVLEKLETHMNKH
jgi:Spy/CpxP family protein refolding chaperone